MWTQSKRFIRVAVVKAYGKPGLVTDIVLQDQEMASPEAQHGHNTFPSGSLSRATPESTSALAARAAIGHLGRLSTEKQQQNLPSSLLAGARLDSADRPGAQIKPTSKAEAGKRGQSQYAQFLRRSSIEVPLTQDADDQPLLRRSSSWGAASNRDPAEFESGARAQNLERQSSRVHFVLAHQSADGDCDSADHVQEAASHREQVSGAAEGECQPQARPQLQRKSLDRQLTFQEMLQQQIQVTLSYLAEHQHFVFGDDVIHHCWPCFPCIHSCS